MADDSSTIIPDDSSDSTVLAPSGGDPGASLFSRILGVTNALARIGGIAVAAGAAFKALEDLVNTNSAPSNFIVPDLANNGSTGFGFRAAAGGAGATSSIIREVNSKTPDDAVLEAGLTAGSWEALDFMINKTLNEDWKTKNADPGNPNIVEAYKLAGRAFTRDGGTGQYSWAAAYVTYILSKSGMSALQTMSPMAYRSYGKPVDFRKGNLEKVRQWDIVIFNSNANIQHVGFVKFYNRTTKTLEIVGGDQAETVKITQMPYSATDPRFYVVHVRRNWTIPPKLDKPLWEAPLGAAPVLPVDVTPLDYGGVAPPSPIDVTYLDDAGNDTGIPVVTNNVDTDTLIYNAGKAIDAAEQLPVVSTNPDRQFYQSTVPLDQRVFAPEAVAGEIASPYQSDILRELNPNSYPMAGEPLNEQDAALLASPRRSGQ